MIKNKLFWKYLFLFSLSFIVAVALNFYSLKPIIIWLVFVLMILVPGFSLGSLLKIKSIGLFNEIIVSIILGFSYSLIFCFLPFLFKWNISNLETFYLIFTFAIFLSALLLDLVRKNFTTVDINLRSFDRKKINYFNLLIGFIVICLVALVLSAIDLQGANFRGDPFFHLAIMRKAIEGQTISAANLSFMKGSIHPAYAFPIWHILLTLLTKITKTDILTTWAEMALPLTALAIIAWYWFFQKVFSNKSVSLIALILFIIFTYEWANGYLFTRLPVPDTLGQFILLPLTLGLALKYVFEKKDQIFLILLGIFSILMAIIHPTQFFYYIFIMIFFTIIYSLFNYKNPEFKDEVKRLIWATTIGLIIVLPFAIFLQINGNIISRTLTTFIETKRLEVAYEKFADIRLISKISYVLLPMLCLLSFKNKKTLIIFSTFLIMPLVLHIFAFKYLVVKTLGLIFANRLYANVTWNYMSWGLMIAFAILIIDWMVAKLFKISKIFRYLIDVIAIMFTFWLFTMTTSSNQLDLVYQKLFSLENDRWLNQNYPYILGVMTILSLLLIWLILQKRIKLAINKFSDYKDPILSASLVIIMTIFLFAPQYKQALYFLKLENKTKRLIKEPYAPYYSLINPAAFGEIETVDFINSQIPPKSIMLVPGYQNYTMPLLIDQYMATYTDAFNEEKYNSVYESDITLNEKLGILANGKIEYILLNAPNNIPNNLIKYPQYFQEIYQTTKTYPDNNILSTSIYKVDVEQVKKDAQLK